MKFTDTEKKYLKLEIDHILDSGANSIRLIEMFERFLNRIEAEKRNIFKNLENISSVNMPEGVNEFVDKNFFELLFEEKHETITDGDTTWVNKCLECGRASMQVVRPGEIQCKYCG